MKHVSRVCAWLFIITTMAALAGWKLSSNGALRVEGHISKALPNDDINIEHSHHSRELTQAAAVVRTQYRKMTSPEMQNSADDQADDQADVVEREAYYSEPKFFRILQEMAPAAERIISHQAYMLGRQLSPSDVREYVKYDGRFAFLLAVQEFCPHCVKSIFFYETNISGEMLSVDEMAALVKSDYFLQLQNAAEAADNRF